MRELLRPEDVFDEDEIWEKVERDETGLIYETFTEDMKRKRIVNLEIEKEIQQVEPIRYLRFYCRRMYDMQRYRIACSNGQDALTRMGIDERELKWIGENVFEKLDEMEHVLELRCRKFLRTMPVWTEYLDHVAGVGPRLAASLIADIVTPRRFDTPSKLVKYAGLSVDIHGNIQKRRRGEVASWNSNLKMTVYKLEDSFIKIGMGYRDLFDQFKHRELEMNEQRRTEWEPFEKFKAEYQKQIHKIEVEMDGLEDEQKIKNFEHQIEIWENKIAELPPGPLTDAHLNQRARRRVGKLFLCHLWQRWRELLDLPIREPYPIAILNHTGYIAPFTDPPRPKVPRKKKADVSSSSDSEQLQESKTKKEPKRSRTRKTSRK